MKKIFLMLAAVAVYYNSQAQTNTFPSSGNVGIGTLSPVAKLQIDGPLNGAPSISIGKPNSPGNINVPMGGVPGGYNIDFYGWRDALTDQIGARIRAERINRYQSNNALIQGMDLVFATSAGTLLTDLTEKMRISYNGNVGIGTSVPKAKLDIVGGVMIQSLLTNYSVRPTVSSNKIPGEIRGYGSAGETADDGFLRLSTGAGTNPAVMSYIDMSSYSTISDMNMNIVFGTHGAERMRIINTGNVGIGTANPTEKLSVNGKIRAQEIKVEATNWPDYVLAEGYALPSLQETEKYITENGHLSGIPSTGEVKINGIELGDMNKKLLQKIEELTLHLIEKDKELSKQNLEIKNQEYRLQKLELLTSKK